MVINSSSREDRKIGKTNNSRVAVRANQPVINFGRPTPISGCFGRCLDVDYRSGLAQYLDALVFYLSGLAALERILQSVAGGAAFGSTEIGGDCLDECVGSRVHFGFRQAGAGCEALL